MFQKSFYCLFLLFSLSILDVGESREQPNADNIFKAYTHTVEVLNKRIAFDSETLEIYEGAYNWDAHVKTRKTIATIWRDSDNGRAAVDFSEYFTHVDETDKRRAKKRVVQMLHANGERISAQTVNDHPLSSVNIDDRYPNNYKISVDWTIVSGLFLDGYAACKTRSLPEIMREGSIRLRDKMEIVDGHKTYVVEAENRYGKQTLWIDPEFGYNPRRIIMRTEADDLHIGDKPLGIPPGEPPSQGIPKRPWAAKHSEEIKVESIQIDNINGVFLLASAEIFSSTTYSSGEVIKTRATHKRTNINLNPDFDAMGAFVLEIPDGVPVTYHGVRGGRGVQYEWFDGKPRAKIDELFLDYLDSQTERLKSETESEMQVVEETEIVPDELPTTVDKQPDVEVDIKEHQPKVLSEADSFPTLIVVLIGLLIIGIIVWLVFRRLNA